MFVRMPFDCEMFVMHDPVAFEAYLNTLPRKRSPQFMSKHIYAGNRDVKANLFSWLGSTCGLSMRAGIEA